MAEHDQVDHILQGLAVQFWPEPLLLPQLREKPFQVLLQPVDAGRILLLLASERQRIFSAQDIYEQVWGEPYLYSSGNTIMVHIRNLRRKLEDDPQNPQIIRNVWGKGYRVE